MPKKQADNFLKFLGTAGARFMMIKQLRASGGLWLSYKGTNLLIDPGPGSIVHCSQSRPKLDPGKLDGILLTHRHLDHTNDVNVMIEGMTEGGFKKRGILFAPSDCFDEDTVVLKHTQNFVEKIEILKENKSYKIGEIEFITPVRHIHTVETYGLKFNLNKTTVSLITDTRYFPELKDYYKADIVIICVVFYEPRPGIDHLCLADAEQLISELRPQKAILTHFGMTMLKAKPHLIEENLNKKFNSEVIAAYDGMTLNLD
ncbi:MAG: MBL fold metallo-hydrolase [Candidatus Omnitrophota bacterium]